MGFSPGHSLPNHSPTGGQRSSYQQRCTIRQRSTTGGEVGFSPLSHPGPKQGFSPGRSLPSHSQLGGQRSGVRQRCTVRVTSTPAEKWALAHCPTPAQKQGFSPGHSLPSHSPVRRTTLRRPTEMHCPGDKHSGRQALLAEKWALAHCPTPAQKQGFSPGHSLPSHSQLGGQRSGVRQRSTIRQRSTTGGDALSG